MGGCFRAARAVAHRKEDARFIIFPDNNITPRSDYTAAEQTVVLS